MAILKAAGKLKTIASSQGLTENMEAAKEGILLKGYFNRKKKAAAKKAAEKAADLKAAEEKRKG